VALVVVDLRILALSGIALAEAVVCRVIAEDVRKMCNQEGIRFGSQEAVSEILQYLVKILAVLPFGDRHSHPFGHQAVLEGPWDVDELAVLQRVPVDKSHMGVATMVADIPSGKIAVQQQEAFRAQTLALQSTRTWSRLPASPSLPDLSPNVLLPLRATASAFLSRPFPTCPS